MHDAGYYTQLDVMKEVCYFYRLPSLESFAVDGMSDQHANDIAIPPHISNLQEIRITHSDIFSDTLGAMIRLPKALRKITASSDRFMSSDGTSSAVFVGAIGRALYDQRTTLHTIDFDFACSTSYGGSSYDQILEDSDSETHLNAKYLRKNNRHRRMDEALSREPFFIENMVPIRPYNMTIGSLSDFDALTVLRIFHGFHGFLA